MRFTLLTFLCLITLVAYVQRSALGVPSKTIEGELGLTPQGMGLVWLAWYAGYAAFQLPSGWVADRLGSKAALLLFAVVWSGLTSLVGLATGFTGLAILWGLMGVAQAGIFPCATKAIGATFLKTEQAFASGMLACCMAGGAALSQEVTGRLFGPLSWRGILAVYALPGLIWAAAFAFVPAPDRPKPKPAGPVAPVPWSRLFTDRDMLLLCGQQFQRAAASALFFTWFPRYLQETKGLSTAQSGSLAAWPLVAGVLGGLVGGTLSDWLLRRTGNERLSRQGLATAAMVVCAVVSFLAFRAEGAEAAVAFISVASFCGYVGGVAAYATALAMGGTRVAPVFATMNMAGNIGAGFFPFAVGQIVGLTGNWNLAILLFAALYVGSGVCWALLNPKGTLFEERHDEPEKLDDPPDPVRGGDRPG
ncbi:MAG TPA: MFS transporter [Gemmataceae bacterium]|nr:MFS transporter [Gemmataceae bacterium]